MYPIPAPEPGMPDHRSPWRYVAWTARRQWPSLVLASAMSTLFMGVQALPPAIIGRVIDAGLTERDPRALLMWVAVLLGTGTVQAVLAAAAHRADVYNWFHAAYRTMQVVARRAGRLGVTLRRRVSSGEVVSVGSSDIEELGELTEYTGMLVGSLVTVAGISVYLLSSSLTLGLLVVIGVPAIVLALGPLIRPYHRRTTTHRERLAELADQAGDIVAGLRVLRGIGGERMFARRYRAASQETRRAGVRVGRFDALLRAAEVLLPGLLVAAVVWFGARAALAGEITTGQLVAFYGYAAYLVVPVQSLTAVLGVAVAGHVAATRIVRVLSLRRDVTDPAAPVPGPAPGGALYDPVSGVTVRPGALTAVACARPADGTALAERLARLRDSDPPVLFGAVPSAAPEPARADTADVVALPDMALAEVRGRILVSDNDAWLFPGPLRSELAPDGASDERLAAALHAASATDIVAALPGGLDGLVTDRGREFSGGQQQRLKLARALLVEPEVLILVEPTSAVDAHTEAAIGERLAKYRSGRTTVLVTTSPLLLDRADRVCHVADGRLMAEGGHRELLRDDPGYARTVRRGDGA
ncbi:ABC transporter transmembrane domain-containing protein [Marinitenerispora sediminis]|uniref:Multidrug ABC transporter permease n=1 Tax=Marinitenerispora sediminis TaxID=1931232 RepID=A0A368T474_9ACTN|nr:ABC transporter ATP-binding protein [Marinitenerispora sediminis]RCV53165.1 multidrug ABC transporter permease [Marinitenerispora sediminis]RCV53706.1 multidrug ABC transporter permease [Marinitenerispora sediminis]RCV58029.1 multidrug ABC transporter permease [Marinitenerispora sediminis]